MVDKIEVTQKHINSTVLKKDVLEICHLPKSTWYDRQKALKKEIPKIKVFSKGRPIPTFTENPDGTIILDSSIVLALKNLRSKIEFANGGGYKKLSAYLRRDFNFFVNKKKIYRLCRENNLLLPKNKKKISSFRKRTINRIITGPNQLWEFDIKYGYIHGENRHFYILIFIDVFWRKVVGFHVGLSCKASDLKITFKLALEAHGLDATSGPVIRSDNGPQMTSNMFRDYIDKLEITHEFIPPKDCNKNAHVESFNSILEAEFLQPRYFINFAQAYRETVEFINFYNNDRVHGSLKMLSPNQFIREFTEGRVSIKSVSL